MSSKEPIFLIQYTQLDKKLFEIFVGERLRFEIVHAIGKSF